MGESKRRKMLDPNYGKSKNIWELSFLSTEQEYILVTRENATVSPESIYDDSFRKKYCLNAVFENITTKETYPCLVIPYLCPDETLLSHMAFLVEKGEPKPKLSQKEVDNITLAVTETLIRDAKNIIKSPTNVKIVLN